MQAFDIAIAVFALFVAAVFLGFLPREARRVRRGDPPTSWLSAVVMRRTRDEQRTPEEFIAKYRGQLTRNARNSLVFGVMLLVLGLGFLPFGAKVTWSPLILGLMFLSQSAGCFRVRRILDAPAAT
jgi:hypothetical protein